MPIYNPYNEVVTPSKFVAPLDLNLLLKGTQYKQEQSEKNFNEIQGQVNNLLSIPAYGKDKEILNQKLQELQQVMGGLDVTNLETPQAKQQINSLINQFSQDKDVQAVAQRGNSYQNMMAEKQDFDKKGKVYMNQGLRKLNQYYSGDDYIRDVKFSNYGYEAPDAGKIMEEVKKIVTPSKKQVPGLNGTMQEIEEYEPEALKKAFEAITNSMPTYKQSLIDNLDNSLEGQDVNELAIKKYQPLLAQYQQNEINAMWLASQTSDPALKTKYLNDAQSAREGINLAQQVLQNPYSGLAYKQAELSSLMNQDLKNMTDALTFHKEGERKMTDVAKMNAEHAHDFNLLAAQQAKEIAVEQAKESIKNGINANNFEILFQDLEDFKQEDSHTRVPAIFQTKFFEKEIQKDKPTYKYTTNEDGTQTLGETSVTTEKVKEAPIRAGYRASDNKFILKYADGSTQEISEQGVKEKMYLTDPKKYKEFKNQSIPNKDVHKHVADLNGEEIYSNDGRTWYNKKGNKID